MLAFIPGLKQDIVPVAGRLPAGHWPVINSTVRVPDAFALISCVALRDKWSGRNGGRGNGRMFQSDS